MRSGKQDGYLSLEASLLFPMVLMVQIICIYLMIYCYDRCVMEQCAYEAALAGADHMIHNNEEAYLITEGKADYMIEDRLFSMAQIKCEVTVTGTEITVVYEGVMRMPFMVFTSMLAQDQNNRIRVEKRIPRINQMKIIRITEQGKEMMQNGFNL